MTSLRTLVVVLAFVGASCAGPGDDAAEPPDTAAAHPDTAAPAAAPAPSATEASEVRVALVGTMSGSGEWRGSPARRGIQVAQTLLEDEGVTVHLSVHDDRGSDRRSTRLVRRAAQDGSVDVILFAGPPRAVAGAERSLAASGTAAFLLYGDLHSAGLLTRRVFQIGPSFRWEAQELVRRAVSTGRGAIGALTEDSVMGETARRALERALSSHDAELQTSEVFSPTRLHQIGQHLQRLRRAGVKRLFIEASPGEFGAINRALRNMSWRPRLFSFDLTLSPPRRGPHAPPGAIASDALERGAHLGYVASFEPFRSAAEEALGEVPSGWEYRSFAATVLAATVAGTEDRSRALEEVRNEQRSGLGATFSRTDHLAGERGDVGLWKRVRRDSRAAARFALPRELPWVPLLPTFD